MNFQPEDMVGLILIGFAVAMVPLFVMSLTCFVKIVVVLNIVRNALGVQQVPPAMVINAVALILTIYILAPIGITAMDAAKAHAGQSSTERIIGMVEAAKEPFRVFLTKHANEREKRFFIKAANSLWPKEVAEKLTTDDFAVAAPAFLVSELTEAFRIGFMLYLAFIVVDLVVANVLVAIGLSQASPTNIAIPFKLLLFVVLDGWSSLLHGLVETYR